MNLENLEYDQPIKHIKSGQIVPFKGVARRRRGVVKIHTTADFGPLDIRAFRELTDEEMAATKPNAVLRVNQHVGGGQYDIIINGEKVARVKGKAAAEAWKPEDSE